MPWAWHDGSRRTPSWPSRAALPDVDHINVSTSVARTVHGFSGNNHNAIAYVPVFGVYISLMDMAVGMLRSNRGPTGCPSWALY
jgi:hypothetical protein